MTADDRNFILSTWLKACRTSLASKRVPNDFYYKYQQKIIERIWARPTSKTVLLVDSEDSNVILGYLCLERPNKEDFPETIIHFAYVKASFQGEGLFKTLLKSENIDLSQELVFTHYTLESAFLKEKHREAPSPYVTAEVIKQKYPQLVYCPYMV